MFQFKLTSERFTVPLRPEEAGKGLAVHMTVNIRKAAFEDMEAIIVLWNDMMLDHQRNDPRICLADGALSAYRAYLGYHLAHSESCVRVADAGGQVIGFVLAAINRNLPMFEPERYGYLSDLAVAAPWRRRGIGRELVKEIRVWLGRRGVDTVQLQYYSFNHAGQAFWRAMDFKPFYTRMWLDMA